MLGALIFPVHSDINPSSRNDYHHVIRVFDHTDSHSLHTGISTSRPGIEEPSEIAYPYVQLNPFNRIFCGNVDEGDRDAIEVSSELIEILRRVR